MITDILTNEKIKQIVNLTNNNKEVVRITDVETGKIVFEKEYDEQSSSD